MHSFKNMMLKLKIKLKTATAHITPDHRDFIQTE